MMSAIVWNNSIIPGETGAGKSSLLNLIMGEHVLPRQVLSSTSTICQIFNSKTKKVVVTDENDEEIRFRDVTEATLSQFVSINRSGNNPEKYKRVDIYWPLPMLKVNDFFYHRSLVIFVSNTGVRTCTFTIRACSNLKYECGWCFKPYRQYFSHVTAVRYESSARVMKHLFMTRCM